MRISDNRKLLVSFFVLVLIGSQTNCGLVGAIRRAQESDSSRTTQTSQSSANPKPIKGKRIRDDRPFAELEHEILADLQNEDFDVIDQKASKARLTKERFSGGYWKLRIIYGPLTEIYTDGFVTEKIWTDHLEKLQRWKQKFPQSVTARVALAQSLIGYAWFARGSGYANTVTDNDGKKAGERLDLAYGEFIEADRLSDKCPQWYASMLFLAKAQGWDVGDYDKLFTNAIRFEPNYYYYYYEMAENSLPRWGGKKGDWEKFAVDLETLDSKEKDIIYFLYVSNMITNYYKEWTDRQSVSWERAKSGYKELEAVYGTNKHRLNQYAFLASVNEDMPEAYNAFMKIGDDWDDEVFSQTRFYEIKNWAVARYSAENQK